MNDLRPYVYADAHLRNESLKNVGCSCNLTYGAIWFTVPEWFTAVPGKVLRECSVILPEITSDKISILAK